MTVAVVNTPVKGFEGKIAGVRFVDGVGETDNQAALDYFACHGYAVDQTQPTAFPDGEPTEKWTVDQLKAYAAAKGIDLKNATTKADILAEVSVTAAEA